MAGTFVYIDGFNLYYRAIKGTAYKWLDLERFADGVSPTPDVTRIRYFTAPVKEVPFNPGVKQRQDVFLRAVRTLPRVRTHFGKFQVQAKYRAFKHPPQGQRPVPDVVNVLLAVEKGSDVNLASWLLMDAFRGRCSQAIVVSNDSDLIEPVRMVHTELGVRVGILNPAGSKYDQLKGSFRCAIPANLLAASQFPTTMTDAQGTFHKPPTW